MAGVCVSRYWSENRFAGCVREAFNRFARSVRSGCRLVNTTAVEEMGIHYQRAGRTITPKVVLNVYILRPILDLAAHGDATAQDRLLDHAIRSGALMMENGGAAFYHFMDKSGVDVLRRAPDSAPAFRAIATSVEQWGVYLMVDPEAHIGGSVTPNFVQIQKNKVRMDLDVAFSYDLFKAQIMQPSGDAQMVQWNRDIFLSIVSKEGGGAAEMLAHISASLDRSNEFTLFMDKNFNGQTFDPKNPIHMALALQDPEFLGMAYDFAVRSDIVEEIGFEAQVALARTIHLDSKALDDYLEQNTNARIAPHANRLKVMLAAAGNTQGVQLMHILRADAFWNDVRYNFPNGVALILEDLYRKHLLRKDLNGQPIRTDDLPFLFDPLKTHENDYRPGRAEYKTPGLPNRPWQREIFTAG